MDDKDKLHKIAMMLLGNLRGTDLDLLIYKTVCAALQQLDLVPNMEELVEEARKSENLRKIIMDKYAPFEKGLQQLGQRDQEKSVLELLKSWRPSGPTN
jgi:hypothetical protein